jgi:ATP-dependent DNA ligase
MFRYPDKPINELARAGLAGLAKGEYIAELKMDGWRTVIYFDGDKLEFTSRQNRPIPVTPAVSAALMQTMIASHVPPGTVFDAEWLARRPACREEAIWVFDVTELGGQPLYSEPVEERFERLIYMLPESLGVPIECHDYEEFFDAMRDRPDAEGIVLKRLGSRYIGSYRESALNPAWLKCKWRAGEDGLTAVC